MIVLKSKNINHIWDNDVCAIFDDLKKSYEEDEKEVSEEFLWEEAYSLVDDYLEDEVANLNIALDRLIAIANIQRWNGMVEGYKYLKAFTLGDAIKEVIASFSGDNRFEVYCQDDHLYISQTGHDNPCNPSIVEIRILNIDEDDLLDCSHETLLANSNPCAKYAKEVYGWD